MTPDSEIQDWIAKTVATHDVVLFMKGNKSMAQCGFSQQVDLILQHLDIDYHDINVLENLGVREGIKEYSQWPTVPQLYIKGEFVGGCDIVREMFQDGELHQILDEKGVSYNKNAALA